MEHEIIDNIEYISIPKPTDVEIEMSTHIKEERRLLETISKELISRKAIISGKTASGEGFKVSLTGKFLVEIEETDK